MAIAQIGGAADTQTQTVLRQMPTVEPTVEVMAISKALGKLQGLLVKEKA